MTTDEIEQAVAERAAVARFAGWYRDACARCGEPRAALDLEAAREIARGHAGVCRGPATGHLHERSGRGGRVVSAVSAPLRHG